MNVPEVVTVDYETHPIEPRPLFPPYPVGVSIKFPGRKSRYYAWAHPTKNNCYVSEARNALAKAWHSDLPILFHNAAFDLSVSYERMELPHLPWQRVHDTMFLLFLRDPHSKSLGLKESAEEILNWPPDEKDAVDTWVWENRAALNAEYGGKDGRPARVTRTKGKVDKLGVWFSCVPGNIVAPYAEGDTDRTAALFHHTYQHVHRTGMMAAYDRERRLLPVFMANERAGLRVDQQALSADLPQYQKALERAEAGMRHYLGAPDLNFNDDVGLADAFVKAGAVHPDRWVTTEKSKQLSVAKDNLPPDAFVDPSFASVFGYRNRLVTCVKMFMQPWLEQAQQSGGYIYTQWNQVRGSRGGARTGRPSMTKPNLLNVSKDWNDRSDGYTHPDKLSLPELPLVRKYILPDEGDLFVHRDFDGQELRVFAHFESGDLLRQYLANPELDPHGWVLQEILKLTDIINEKDRTKVKTLNFQSLYGGGINAISEKLRCSRAEAQAFKNFHDSALPGRKILSEEIQRIVRRQEPIRTWGGRLYYCEPPSFVNGRMQTWEYKLINYLIQGSAADITKEAICRWHEGGGPGRLLLTVYDEVDLSVATDQIDEGMRALREIMDGIELDCPMRSSGKVGESWGKVAKYIDT